MYERHASAIFTGIVPFNFPLRPVAAPLDNGLADRASSRKLVKTFRPGPDRLSRKTSFWLFRRTDQFGAWKISFSISRSCSVSSFTNRRLSTRTCAFRTEVRIVVFAFNSAPKARSSGSRANPKIATTSFVYGLLHSEDYRERYADI